MLHKEDITCKDKAIEAQDKYDNGLLEYEEIIELEGVIEIKEEDIKEAKENLEK